MLGHSMMLLNAVQHSGCLRSLLTGFLGELISGFR